MVRFFLIPSVVLVLLGLLAISQVKGDGCVVRQRTYYSAPAYYAAPAYYPPVATYYQIPVYSFGYSSGDVELQLKLLRADMELQQLRQELKSFQQQQPQPEKLNAPKKQAQQHPFEGTMQKSCITCHSVEQAKAKGNGFVLSDGKGFMTLTDRQIREMQRRIYSGNMPKGSKLTDQQVGEAMDWLDQIQSVEDLASQKK